MTTPPTSASTPEPETVEQIAKLRDKAVHLDADITHRDIESAVLVIDQLLAERDSGYPTAWAYEKVCETLNNCKAQLAAKDKLLVMALEALDKLARLGNEPYFGNSAGNTIAWETLANIAALSQQDTSMEPSKAATSSDAHDRNVASMQQDTGSGGGA